MSGPFLSPSPGREKKKKRKDPFVLSNFLERYVLLKSLKMASLLGWGVLLPDVAVVSGEMASVVPLIRTAKAAAKAEKAFRRDIAGIF